MDFDWCISSDDEPEASDAARSGDCMFYEYFERKFSCSDDGVSQMADIEYPLCTSGYTKDTLMDATVRRSNCQVIFIPQGLLISHKVTGCKELLPACHSSIFPTATEHMHVFSINIEI